MKRSKLDLLLGGHSFFQRTAMVAGAVFDEVIAVARSDQEIAVSIPVIREKAHEGTAAIFGLAAALEQSTSPRSWVLAVDYPLLTTELLRFLRKRYEESRAALLVPRTRDALQMLCAGYSRQIVPELQKKIEAGDYRLKSLVDEVESEIVTPEELEPFRGGEALTNVNFPEDYERVRRIHGE